MKRKRKAVTVAVCVILVLGIITLIVFPPSKGEVSAYKDAKGKTFKKKLKSVYKRILKCDDKEK